MNRPLQVIYEDNHLLAVAKPAGLLVQGDRSGDRTLQDEVRDYLREKHAKPGNIYLGLVHRLDRNVSGIVLLARTSKAAGRLSAAFREGRVAKTYLAIVPGRPDPPAGKLRNWLAAKGDADGVTLAAHEPFAEARESLLEYRLLEEAGRQSLLEVKPITGRRHQIRAQLALAGWPLLGDAKYGSGVRLPNRRLALHALVLDLEHPVGGGGLHLVCDPPVDWPWPPG